MSGRAGLAVVRHVMEAFVPESGPVREELTVRAATLTQNSAILTSVKVRSR